MSIEKLSSRLQALEAAREVILDEPKNPMERYLRMLDGPAPRYRGVCPYTPEEAYQLMKGDTQ